ERGVSSGICSRRRDPVRLHPFLPPDPLPREQIFPREQILPPSPPNPCSYMEGPPPLSFLQQILSNLSKSRFFPYQISPPPTAGREKKTGGSMVGREKKGGGSKKAGNSRNMPVNLESPPSAPSAAPPPSPTLPPFAAPPPLAPQAAVPPTWPAANP
ncbi:unnamed protein product, partial [Urochloa humidicola]